MLKYLLVLLVWYVPNMMRFQVAIPIPGMNLLNLLFLACVLSYYVSKKKFPTPSPKAPLRGYLYFFWFVSFLALINAAMLGHKPNTIEDWIFYKNHVFYMCLYFLVFYAVRDWKVMNWVYWATIVTVAVAGLQAVVQAQAIGATSYSTGARVSGPFGYGWQLANFAGAFYAQYAPLIFCEMMYQKDRRIQAAMAAAFGVTVMGLFFTYSRKSYYALAAALTLVSATVNKKALLFIAVALVTFPLWAPQSAVERLFSEPEEPTAQAAVGAEAPGQDESTRSRFILWQGAVDMLADYPLGIGLERFKHHIGQYSVYSNLDAHNYYVLVLAEMGPLGEVAFLLLVFMTYLEGGRLWRVARTPRERALAAGFKGCMLSFMIINTFGSAFNFGIAMGNLWILAALVSRARIMIEQEEAQARQQARQQARVADAAAARPGAA